MSNHNSDRDSPAQETGKSAGSCRFCASKKSASSALALAYRSVNARELRRRAARTQVAFSSLMKATKSRSPLIGFSGGGVMRSRWNESRRSAVSSRCAATSCTRHAPAMVGRCQSAGSRRRSRRTISTESGRNSWRVSVIGSGIRM